MIIAYAVFAAASFGVLYGLMHRLFPRSWPFWKCALFAAFWPITLLWQILRKFYK